MLWQPQTHYLFLEIYSTGIKKERLTIQFPEVILNSTQLKALSPYFGILKLKVFAGRFSYLLQNDQHIMDIFWGFIM